MRTTPEQFKITDTSTKSNDRINFLRGRGNAGDQTQALEHARQVVKLSFVKMFMGSSGFFLEHGLANQL